MKPTGSNEPKAKNAASNHDGVNDGRPFLTKYKNTINGQTKHPTIAPDTPDFIGGTTIPRLMRTAKAK
jgi:hypothetical protein